VVLFQSPNGKVKTQPSSFLMHLHLTLGHEVTKQSELSIMDWLLFNSPTQQVGQTLQ
jgi:hypothetical protein